MSAITMITKRAKAIRKTYPGKAWKSCIEMASKEYRAKKKGRKVGSTGDLFNSRQTGTSNKKRDEERSAKPPGKRKSATGKTYYERRKNRSDVPGSLSGARWMLKENARKELAKALLLREMSSRKMDKKYWGQIVRKRKAEVKKYS